MREYHVVEIKKKSAIYGRMRGKDLAAALNKEAADGWTFDKAISGESRFLGSDNHMLVFYREK